MTATLPFDTDQTTFDAPRAGHKKPPRSAAAEQNIQCLCPFCGEFNTGVGKPCLHCNKMDTTATRALATDHAGLWFVRDEDHSVEPEMEFEQLQSLIHLQLVTSQSVVRGPGTGQLWRLAGTVRGLSREFGQCYCCGNQIDAAQDVCAHCDCVQTLQASSAPVETDREFVPETSGPAREELLSEPKIRVHPRGELDETSSNDYYFVSRPVIAERSGRHVPKDDLLTPRDLAKAFEIEFEPEYLNAGLPGRVVEVARQAKVVLACGGAIAIGFLLGMQGLRIVAAGNLPPVPETAAVDSTTVKLPPLDPPVQKFVEPEHRLATDAEKPVVKVANQSLNAVKPTLPQVVAETPQTAGARANPASVEPTPATPVEDNPTVLMNAGFTAESNGNFAAAVRFYERIQSLPSSQWPVQLKTRLQMARAELKGDLH